MFTTLSKMLPAQQEDTKSMSEFEIDEWANKIKTNMEKLMIMQNNFASQTSYWSAFFENQVQLTRTTSNVDENWTSTIVKCRADSFKKIGEFEKRFSAKVRDMRAFLENSQKLIKRREDKKIEKSKIDYYYNLLDNKSKLQADAGEEDGNILQMTQSEKSEFENLKSQMSRIEKEMLRLETQMHNSFPDASKTFAEFVDSTSDMIYYEQLEIHDFVSKAFQSFFDNSKMAETHSNLINNWKFDLNSIKRQIANIDITKNRNNFTTPQTQVVEGYQFDNPVTHNLTPNPSNKVKVNSSGMRALNLDPKKSVRRSMTLTHRRNGSKNFDFKPIAADTLSPPQGNTPTGTPMLNGAINFDNRSKRNSMRSFTSFSESDTNLAVNTQNEDDTYSFTSSISNDDTETNPLHIATGSPQASPIRFGSKRSSIVSTSSDFNRMSLLSMSPIAMTSTTTASTGNVSSTNNRQSIYHKNRGMEASSLQKSMFNDPLITECPVTAQFKAGDENLKRLAKLKNSMAAQLYLNMDRHYAQDIVDSGWDYRKLTQKRSKKTVVQAQKDFHGNLVGSLSFAKDEQITVLSEKCALEHWWVGKIGARVGVFPSETVAKIT